MRAARPQALPASRSTLPLSFSWPDRCRCPGLPGASCYGKERRREMRSPRESGSPFPPPRAEHGARTGARRPLPLSRQRRAVAMKLLLLGVRSRSAPPPQAGVVRAAVSGGGAGGPGSNGRYRGCLSPCGSVAVGGGSQPAAPRSGPTERQCCGRAPAASALPHHLQAGLCVRLRMPARVQSVVWEVPYNKRPSKAWMNGSCDARGHDLVVGC